MCKLGRVLEHSAFSVGFGRIMFRNMFQRALRALGFSASWQEIGDLGFL